MQQHIAMIHSLTMMDRERRTVAVGSLYIGLVFTHTRWELALQHAEAHGHGAGGRVDHRISHRSRKSASGVEPATGGRLAVNSERDAVTCEQRRGRMPPGVSAVQSTSWAGARRLQAAPGGTAEATMADRKLKVSRCEMTLTACDIMLFVGDGVFFRWYFTEHRSFNDIFQK